METKIKSYWQTVAEGLPKRHRQVLEVLSEYGGTYSRKQIASFTGLSLQCVCGRVNELLKMGAITEGEQMYDFATQRRVEGVRIPDGIHEIKPMEKKITPTKMKEYIDYLWNFRRTDVDVCSLEDWA